MQAKRLSPADLATACALAALMAATRFHHFGSSINLPDASLAVFFLGGFFLRRAALFGVYAAGAVLIDFLAITYGGASDWCVTAAYAFLLPTYACMWWAGAWCANRAVRSWPAYLRIAGVLLGATALAFFISNASFYAFSGHFSALTVVEYSARVAKYFPAYLASAAAYVAAGFAVQFVVELAARAWPGATPGET